MKSFVIDRRVGHLLNEWMRYFLGVFAVVGFLLAGCARHKAEEYGNVPGPSQTAAELPPSIITADNSLRGKVATFNAAGRFVIMEFPIGHMPSVGQKLFVYRNNLKVGEVTVTGPQRDDRTVGDLTTGEAQRNDEIRVK